MQEYPITGKGAYIIVKLDRQNFTKPWDTLPPLNYEPDMRNLIETLNLDRAPNILVGENLTRDPGDGGFDYFMDNLKQMLIEKDKSNEKPSFIMFVLMSHGLINGGFFLATPEPADKSVVPCSCNDQINHRGDDGCYVRYISQHVMAKVSDAFPLIPKIFLIQACRGNQSGVVIPGAADRPLRPPEAPSEIELFNLKFSDCFLFRSCVEQQKCWVLNDGQGSYFIDKFCYALNMLRYTAKYHAEEVEKLLAITSSSGSDSIKEFTAHISSESFVNGWLGDVCQYTSALVANVLINEKHQQSGIPHDKQQPHYSSSLAYKFSCLKMLKTQWQLEDSYLDDWYHKKVANERVNVTEEQTGTAEGQSNAMEQLMDDTDGSDEEYRCPVQAEDSCDISE